MRARCLAVAGMIFLAGSVTICSGLDFPGRLLAGIDKKEMTIGEQARYAIAVTADRGIGIEFPDLTEAFKGLEIVDSGERSSGFFRKRTRTLWVVFRSFTPGTYTIPPQKVRYKYPDKEWAEALTGACSINVVSLAQKAHAGAQIADIKGPLDMRTALPVIALAAAFIIALIIVFRNKIFRTRARAAAEVQPWKAHEIAYARLDDLRRQGLLSKGMIKQYYSELSDILRHYLENRFSLKAPEMTTEEFIGYVREYGELERAHKDLLKEFLTNCDLVKFAKHIPPENEGDAAFDTARRFVDETRSPDAEAHKA
ncbi:MAG TPA: BatD family protein [Candidatus Omnitrophota bacterium]|nr:BatD family protein [Candidatus Omnitrophota bacterium]HQJ16200.1 BatD family protein [Candidatus Omnitrophota bacterium]